MTFSVVDIFGINLNTWRIANLPHFCAYLAASTVGNIVLFACNQCFFVVDIYNATFNTWNLTNLSQFCEWLAFIMVLNLAIFGRKDAGPGQNTLFIVDIYNFTFNS